MKSQRGWRAPGKQGALNQHDQHRTHRDQGSMHHGGLQCSVAGPLHMCLGFQFVCFIGFFSVWTSGPLFLVLVLWLLYFCLLCPILMFLAYYNLIVFFFPIEFILLSNGKQKWGRSRWEGTCRGIHRSRRKGNHNQDVLCVKNITFH